MRPGQTNVTVELSAFVGRAAELAALERRFEAGSRVVTLTGPGGIGKTRLARQYARGALAAWPGGIWFADLSASPRAPKADAAAMVEVCARVAGAIGTAVMDTGEDELAQLGRQLAGRGRLLLILDNAEHVVASCVQALVAWAGVAPEACFLVTSRERLPAASGDTVRMAPLSLPGQVDHPWDAESVQLFVARAREVAAGFAPDATHRAAVRHIVTALDGHPLAIELAAARMDILSPTALQQRLSERFDVLAATAPGGRSLHAVLSWSWSLLSPAEQHALTAVSCFRGPVTSEAAHAVIGEAVPEPLDVLAGLARKSLLVTTEVDGGRRLGLYESVRAWAEARLDADPEGSQTIRERHAAYFLDRARALGAQLESGERPARALLGDVDEMLAALQRGLDEGTPTGTVRAAEVVCSLAPFFRTRGPMARLASLLAALFARRADLPAALAARVGAQLGELHYARGEPEAGVSVLELARAAAEEAACATALAWVQMAQGIVLGDAQTASALALLQAAEETFARVGDAPAVATALIRQGVRHVRGGDPDAATDCWHRAWQHAHDAGARRLCALALNNRGTLAAKRDDRPQALTLHRAALAALEDSDDLVLAGLVLANLGESELDVGHVAVAEACFRDALGIARGTGFIRTEAIARAHLGAIHHLRGDLAAARRDYEEARRHLDTGWQDSESPAILRAYLGACEAGLGQWVSAAAHFASARQVYETHADPLLMGSLQVLELLLERADDVPWSGLLARADAIAAAAATRRTPQWHRRGHHLRFARRLLAAAAAEGSGPSGGDEPDLARTLTVDSDGTWFELAGERVPMGRRRAPRLLLLALCRRGAGPDARSAGIDELFACGWPDESVAEPHRSNRLYFAIATLRNLGLGGLLLHDGDGYRLSPSVAVVWR